jgi:ribose 5-phosphate isomerase B
VRLGVVLRSAKGATNVAAGQRAREAQVVPSPAPAASGRTIALGADHGGVALKEIVAGRLRELGHAVTDLGTTGTDAVDYPDYAIAVARAVASGSSQIGVMVDGAGIGSCMASNKVAGVRAAMCYDVTTAQNAREHNNANVLTLGGGLIGPRLALAIVEAFLATPFAGGRHATRVAKIDALDSPRARR